MTEDAQWLVHREYLHGYGAQLQKTKLSSKTKDTWCGEGEEALRFSVSAVERTKGHQKKSADNGQKINNVRMDIVGAGSLH